MTGPVSAGLDDAPMLARIHAAAFPAPWSAYDLANLMAAPGAFALKVPAGGAPQGFILAHAAAGEAEIITLAVLPRARRKGFGRLLAGHAIAALAARGVRRLHLEVGARNRAARALYAGLGFAETGRRPGYYRAGREHAGDALVLSLAIAVAAAGRDGSHVPQNPV